MPLSPQRVPEGTALAGFASLHGCLVEDDAEQRVRQRRVRRRALVISIVLQSTVLAALVLVPLFGKTERIALGGYVPISPYRPRNSHPRSAAKPATSKPTSPDSRFTLHPLTNRPVHDPGANVSPNDPGDDDPSWNPPDVGPDCTGCADLGSKNNGPRPPQSRTETDSRPRVVQMTHLDPAMLIHRAEPVYPPLARQLHREGRVELHAIIGTDGTIQALQIVAGDPLFLLSAREAVQQWRYKPTILNGQVVEIDTYITVIYTMQR